MKLFNTIIFAASVLLLSAQSMAQLNTFEAGTPASAAEMNANFTMISNAFDELEARVIALEDAASDMSVIGRRYGINEYLFTREEQDDPVNIGEEVIVETIGFTRILLQFTDATNGWIFYTASESDLILPNVGGVSVDHDATLHTAQIDSGTQVINFTYAQALGTNLVTVTLADGSGDQFEFFVSKDGTNITQFFQVEGFTDGDPDLNIHEFSFMQGFEIPVP